MFVFFSPPCITSRDQYMDSSPHHQTPQKPEDYPWNRQEPKRLSFTESDNSVIRPDNCESNASPTKSNVGEYVCQDQAGKSAPLDQDGCENSMHLDLVQHEIPNISNASEGNGGNSADVNDILSSVATSGTQTNTSDTTCPSSAMDNGTKILSTNSIGGDSTKITKNNTTSGAKSVSTKSMDQSSAPGADASLKISSVEPAVMSNLYPCTIVYKRMVFNCVQQAFEWKKATDLGDDQLADLILKAKDGFEAKSLGEKLEQSKVQAWITENSHEILRTLIQYKFNYVRIFHDACIKAKNSVIVETSLDGYTSSSLLLGRQTDTELDLFSKKNVVGRIIMEVTKDYLDSCVICNTTEHGLNTPSCPAFDPNPGRRICFAQSTDVMSNIYPCDLIYNKETFNSVEHGLHWQKATDLGETEVADQILKAKNGFEARTLSRQISRDKVKSWEKYSALNVMERLIKCKFDQVDVFHEACMESDDAVLMLATPDMFWGVGVWEDAAQNCKVGFHPGRNHLGQIIMKVRDEFRVRVASQDAITTALTPVPHGMKVSRQQPVEKPSSSTFKSAVDQTTIESTIAALQQCIDQTKESIDQTKERLNSSSRPRDSQEKTNAFIQWMNKNSDSKAAVEARASLEHQKGEIVPENLDEKDDHHEIPSPYKKDFPWNNSENSGYDGTQKSQITDTKRVIIDKMDDGYGTVYSTTNHIPSEKKCTLSHQEQIPLDWIPKARQDFKADLDPKIHQTLSPNGISKTDGFASLQPNRFISRLCDRDWLRPAPTEIIVGASGAVSGDERSESDGADGAAGSSGSNAGSQSNERGSKPRLESETRPPPPWERNSQEETEKSKTGKKNTKSPRKSSKSPKKAQEGQRRSRSKNRSLSEENEPKSKGPKKRSLSAKGRKRSLSTERARGVGDENSRIRTPSVDTVETTKDDHDEKPAEERKIKSDKDQESKKKTKSKKEKQRKSEQSESESEDLYDEALMQLCENSAHQYRKSRKEKVDKLMERKSQKVDPPAERYEKEGEENVPYRPWPIQSRTITVGGEREGRDIKNTDRRRNRSESGTQKRRHSSPDDGVFRDSSPVARGKPKDSPSEEETQERDSPSRRSRRGVSRERRDSTESRPPGSSPFQRWISPDSDPESPEQKNSPERRRSNSSPEIRMVWRSPTPKRSHHKEQKSTVDEAHQSRKMSGEVEKSKDDKDSTRRKHGKHSKEHPEAKEIKGKMGDEEKAEKVAKMKSMIQSLTTKIEMKKIKGAAVEKARKSQLVEKRKKSLEKRSLSLDDIGSRGETSKSRDKGREKPDTREACYSKNTDGKSRPPKRSRSLERKRKHVDLKASSRQSSTEAIVIDSKSTSPASSRGTIMVDSESERSDVRGLESGEISSQDEKEKRKRKSKEKKTKKEKKEKKNKKEMKKAKKRSKSKTKSRSRTSSPTRERRSVSLTKSSKSNKTESKSQTRKERDRRSLSDERSHIRWSDSEAGSHIRWSQSSQSDGESSSSDTGSDLPRTRRSRSPRRKDRRSKKEKKGSKGPSPDVRSSSSKAVSKSGSYDIDSRSRSQKSQSAKRSRSSSEESNLEKKNLRKSRKRSKKRASSSSSSSSSTSRSRSRSISPESKPSNRYHTSYQPTGKPGKSGVDAAISKQERSIGDDSPYSPSRSQKSYKKIARKLSSHVVKISPKKDKDSKSQRSREERSSSQSSQEEIIPRRDKEKRSQSLGEGSQDNRSRSSEVRSTEGRRKDRSKSPEERRKISFKIASRLEQRPRSLDVRKVISRRQSRSRSPEERSRGRTRSMSSGERSSSSSEEGECDTTRSRSPEETRSRDKRSRSPEERSRDRKRSRSPEERSRERRSRFSERESDSDRSSRSERSRSDAANRPRSRTERASWGGYSRNYIETSNHPRSQDSTPRSRGSTRSDSDSPGLWKLPDAIKRRFGLDSTDSPEDSKRRRYSSPYQGFNRRSYGGNQCVICKSQDHLINDPKCPAYDPDPERREYFKGHTCVMSNMYACPIKYLGKDFSSTEHAYQWKKAVDIGSDDIADLILKARDGYAAKTLSHQLDRGKVTQWKLTSSVNVMKELINCKFNQVKVFRDACLDSGDAILMEATWDYFWGIGLLADQARNCKKERIPGKNVLGNIIMKVRDDYKAGVKGQGHQGRHHSTPEGRRSMSFGSPLDSPMPTPESVHSFPAMTPPISTGGSNYGPPHPTPPLGGFVDGPPPGTNKAPGPFKMVSPHMHIPSMQGPQQGAVAVQLVPVHRMVFPPPVLMQTAPVRIAQTETVHTTEETMVEETDLTSQEEGDKKVTTTTTTKTVHNTVNEGVIGGGAVMVQPPPVPVQVGVTPRLVRVSTAPPMPGYDMPVPLQTPPPAPPPPSMQAPPPNLHAPPPPPAQPIEGGFSIPFPPPNYPPPNFPPPPPPPPPGAQPFMPRVPTGHCTHAQTTFTQYYSETRTTASSAGFESDGPTKGKPEMTLAEKIRKATEEKSKKFLALEGIPIPKTTATESIGTAGEGEISSKVDAIPLPPAPKPIGQLGANCGSLSGLSVYESDGLTSAAETSQEEDQNSDMSLEENQENEPQSGNTGRLPKVKSPKKAAFQKDTNVSKEPAIDDQNLNTKDTEMDDKSSQPSSGRSTPSFLRDDLSDRSTPVLDERVSREPTPIREMEIISEQKIMENQIPGLGLESEGDRPGLLGLRRLSKDERGPPKQEVTRPCPPKETDPEPPKQVGETMLPREAVSGPPKPDISEPQAPSQAVFGPSKQQVFGPQPRSESKPHQIGPSRQDLGGPQPPRDAESGPPTKPEQSMEAVPQPPRAPLSRAMLVAYGCEFSDSDESADDSQELNRKDTDRNISKSANGESGNVGLDISKVNENAEKRRNEMSSVGKNIDRKNVNENRGAQDEQPMGVQCQKSRGGSSGDSRNGRGGSIRSLHAVGLVT